jgi:hypothetical protein
VKKEVSTLKNVLPTLKEIEFPGDNEFFGSLEED